MQCPYVTWGHSFVNKSRLMYYLSEDFFIFIQNQKVYLWDYKLHEQYLIEDFHTLCSFLEKTLDVDSDEFGNFYNANLISLHKSSETKKKWNWDILSRIFHVGTQDLKPDLSGGNYEEYLHKYFKFMRDIEKGKPKEKSYTLKGYKVPLPDPKLNEVSQKSLLDALVERKTCRNFFFEPVELEKIATVLDLCFGINKVGSDHHKKRYVPSAGGLMSAEGYLLSLNVQDLPKGIFYYDYINHNLICIEKIDLRSRMYSLMQGQQFAENLSFGVFVTSRFDSLSWKYRRSQNYRVALLDIGHISQNFELVSTALSIDPWITGAFSDKEINELLKIDNIDESVMFFLGGGIGNRSRMDPLFAKVSSEYRSNEDHEHASQE